jgi:hypothetical protein
MRKILLALLIVIILIAGCTGGCEMLNRTTYIEGTRVGYIVRFTQRGLFFKSYQGEVNMGGVMNSAMGGATPNTWNFSLDNQRRHNEDLDTLVAAINVFLGQGKPVKITYCAPFFSWPWRSSNRYLVQKVEAIPEK